MLLAGQACSSEMVSDQHGGVSVTYGLINSALVLDKHLIQLLNRELVSP